jgi:hypothetical protein
MIPFAPDELIRARIHVVSMPGHGRVVGVEVQPGLIHVLSPASARDLAMHWQAKDGGDPHAWRALLVAADQAEGVEPA